MTTPTPTPGQPLSEADVSLLQPGDWLLHKDGTVHRILSAIEGWVFVADWREPIRHFTFLGRPDQDGWIAWSGGPRPHPPQTIVRVRYRDGTEDEGQSAFARWWHEPNEADRDIIAYRIVPHAPVSRPGDGVEGVRSLSLEDAAELHRQAAVRAKVLAPRNEWGWYSSDADPVRSAAWALIEHFERVDADERSKAVIASAVKALSTTPSAEPVSRPAGEGEREAVDLWYLVKNAIARAMMDERDGKPCGCIIEAGCEARGYHDPAYAADGFMVSATDAILSLLRPAAPDAGGGEDLAGKLKAIRDKFLFPTPDKDHTDYAVMTRCIAALQPGGER